MSVMASKVIEDFMSGLPSSDPANFQMWPVDGRTYNITAQPPPYIPTREIPCYQVIVNETSKTITDHIRAREEIAKRDELKRKREEELLAGMAEEERKRMRFYMANTPRMRVALSDHNYV